MFIEIFKPWLELVGIIAINLYYTSLNIVTGRINYSIFLTQTAKIGSESLGISMTMTIITGMIVALQISSEMVKQGAGDYVGALVTVSMVRELGPVMTGFAVIALIGSSMAAEAGTMKVTEQIDAMKVFKVDPYYYIITPRILAGIVSIPMVTILAITSGIIGGMIIANLTSDLSYASFIDSTWKHLDVKDIYASVIKGIVFGALIVIFSLSIGLNTYGGAKEVGESTTRAVVWSFVGLVIANFWISYVYFG